MAFVDLDGDEKPRFVSTLVCDLSHDVVEELASCLNPRLSGKDYRSLAGKMGFKLRDVKNLDRCANPTEELLDRWNAMSPEGTVSELMDLFRQMSRFDVIKILEKNEYTRIAKPRPGSLDSSSSAYKEPTEHSINDDYDTDEDTNMSIYNGNSPDRYDSRSSSISRSRTNTADNSNLIHPDNHSLGATAATGTAVTIAATPPAPASVLSECEDEKLRRKLANCACENDDEATFHPYYGYRKEVPNSPMQPWEHDDATNAIPGRLKPNAQTGGPQQAVMPSSFTPTQEYTTPLPASSWRHNNNPPPAPSPSPSPSQPNTSPSLGAPIIATDKIALLIGNMTYEHLEEPLVFPKKDVFDLSSALTKLGFKVLSLVDLKLIEMRTIMLAYCQLLGPGVFAVFYYAGHGFEENGENYLMPVDATPEKREEEFVKAQEFLTEMQLAQTKLNLVIIDACRVKGINIKTSQNSGFRRNDYGNTIIAYSCQSHMPAFESRDQKNGVYMSELLPRIQQDVRIEHILMDVNQAVHGNSLVVQRPVFESDSTGDCRLTTLINQEALVEHWKHRFDSWYQATTPPDPQEFYNEEGNVQIILTYSCMFSNVLRIEVSLKNLNPHRVTFLSAKLGNGSGLRVTQSEISKFIDPFPSVKRLCHFFVEDLQMVNASLLLVLEIQVELCNEVRNIDMKLNGGYPLISSVLQDFHCWITADQRASTGAIKNTWV